MSTSHKKTASLASIAAALVIISTGANSADLAKWDASTDKWKMPVSGSLKIKNSGKISYGVPGYGDNYFQANNTLRFNFTGKKVDITTQCKILVTNSATICFNALSRKFEGTKPGAVECTLAGISGSFPSIPGLTASACTTLTLSGQANKKPSGNINVSVQVGANGFGNKNVNLFKQKF